MQPNRTKQPTICMHIAVSALLLFCLTLAASLPAGIPSDSKCLVNVDDG